MGSPIILWTVTGRAERVTAMFSRTCLTLLLNESVLTIHQVYANVMALVHTRWESTFV